MEIILAIVVGVAVIFFGALISMGNERQRKAIDSLREQIIQWAMQDLRIKRERLAREVRVDDPLGWINKIATKVLGCDLNLQVIEVFKEPCVLICASEGDNRKFLFSPLSPSEIYKVNHDRRNRLSQYTDSNPLIDLPRKVKSYEFSVLNGDILFDLELPIAWKGLTNQGCNTMERLWMYVMS